MVWTWIFIALYSVSVFLFLLHFHQVEYYLNWGLVLLLLIIFWIYLFCVWIWTAGNGMFWSSVDKLMISVWFMIAVIVVLIYSIVLVFDSNLASIQYVFLIFVIYILLYFILCIFDKKTIKSDTLVFIYLIFYFVFLCPVLFQAISNLWILWKLWNFLFWISPLFLTLFRTYLVDFLGSWFFIRKYFLDKDSEIWNCPKCHFHIIKKPFRFCPHCGNDKYSSHSLNNSIYCNSCWFAFKIKDFDFPNYCPHCGLSFRKRKAAK